MVDKIQQEKQGLRRQYKLIRKEIGDIIRKQASIHICERLNSWTIFQKAQTILSYMPMHTEVDLRSLFVDFPKKHWLIPRILPDKEGQMTFHLYDPDHLVQHPFGMEEPAPYLPKSHPGDIDLVLVPGLAFSYAGWRLGYGGGFYDRFLGDFGGISVGVVFQTLLLENLPYEKYDIPVNWIVTEKEIYVV